MVAAREGTSKAQTRSSSSPEHPLLPPPWETADPITVTPQSLEEPGRAWALLESPGVCTSASSADPAGAPADDSAEPDWTPTGHMVQSTSRQQGPLADEAEDQPNTIPADQLQEVKYRGPIEVTELLGYEAGPSIQSRDAEIPKREQIVRECQSDSFFDWLHALATILIFHEPLILSGLKSTELTTLWHRRIATLSKVPWIFGPLLLVRNVSHRTSWMEAMSARLADNDHGRLTVALAAPDGSQSHATITAYFGILGGLFRSMWDRTEMSALLETDDNFEIVASTAKSIYDRTCRACDLDNRLIFLQHIGGRVQRGMRIDHRAGDTDAKKNYLNQQKRLAERSAAPADKRHREGQDWWEPRWQQSGWWHGYQDQSSGSEDRSDHNPSTPYLPTWQWRKRY